MISRGEMDRTKGMLFLSGVSRIAFLYGVCKW